MMKLTRIIIAKLGMHAMSFMVVFTSLSLGGCNDHMNMPQSQFLSRFQIDQSLRNTAFEGIEYSGPGGSIGGVTGGIGEQETDVHQSSTTGFTIQEGGASRFDEGRFMEALKARIKKEIEKSGARITGGESSSTNEFNIGYREGDTEGMIRIIGSRRGKYYEIRAEVKEKGKR